MSGEFQIRLHTLDCGDCPEVVWIIDNITSLFVRKSSQALEGGGYLIRFGQILGPHGGDFDHQITPEKSNAPHIPGVRPFAINTDRCITNCTI